MGEGKTMRVYTVEDYTGVESIHLAVNEKSAIQAHLMHYGLFYISGDIKVVKVRDLIEVRDRGEICFDKYCCLIGATDYNKEECYGKKNDSSRGDR